jgi:hypothetical protein
MRFEDLSCISELSTGWGIQFGEISMMYHRLVGTPLYDDIPTPFIPLVSVVVTSKLSCGRSGVLLAFLPKA